MSRHKYCLDLLHSIVLSMTSKDNDHLVYLHVINIDPYYIFKHLLKVIRLTLTLVPAWKRVSVSLA